MILKHLMEDKQLDLYQPFISVRRLPISAPSSESEEKKKNTQNLLPVYKSELKSGPIRNPGTVPFLWEQIPGRPKDEGKTQTCFAQRPPIAPKPPPGRILKGDVVSSSLNAESFDEVLMKHDSLKNEDEDDDGSEAYMDARDTLSRTESSSSFLNCSSFSGLNDLYVNPFGTFSDPQTYDFMMDRFLPAAKAMASESPHYTTRKQPLARDQPRQMSMIASVNKQSFYQHRPTNVAKESEEDSDNEPEYASAKGCGLFPQFCLLNPVPGLRMKSCGSISLVPRASSRETQKKHYEDAYLYEQNTKLKSESNSIAFKSNGKELEGASLYMRMQCNGIKELSSCQGRNNLGEVLDSKSTEYESGEASCVVEKTLYIDSMHVVKPLGSDSSPSDTKRNDLDSENAEERIDSENEQLAESKHSDRSHLLLPPPLPKSPSESWLSRTLPVVSSRKQPSFGTYSYNRAQVCKTPSLDPKWEMIVKTSNVDHGHLRFSEELVTTIAET